MYFWNSLSQKMFCNIIIIIIIIIISAPSDIIIYIIILIMILIENYSEILAFALTDNWTAFVMSRKKF